MNRKIQTAIFKINILKKNSLLSVFFLFLIFYYSVTSPILAEYRKASAANFPRNVPAGRKKEAPLPEEKWVVFKSAYFTVFYPPDADLKAIYMRLKERSFYFIPGGKKQNESGYEKKIGKQLDVLFRRAKEMLGMNPRTGDIKIRIFKNQEALDEEHRRLLGERKSYVSFYVYKYNTIYTTETGISDSVMAHEMGHAIVDHYFTIRPSESVREILSTYVDRHLDAWAME